MTIGPATVDTRAFCSKVEINIYRAASPQPKSTAKSNGGRLVDSVEGVAFKPSFALDGMSRRGPFNSKWRACFLINLTLFGISR